jgi:hypothetical protein
VGRPETVIMDVLPYGTSLSRDHSHRTSTPFFTVRLLRRAAGARRSSAPHCRSPSSSRAALDVRQCRSPFHRALTALVRWVYQRHLETVLYGRSDGSSGPIWKVMNARRERKRKERFGDAVHSCPTSRPPRRLRRPTGTTTSRTKATMSPMQLSRRPCAALMWPRLRWYGPPRSHSAH